MFKTVVLINTHQDLLCDVILIKVLVASEESIEGLGIEKPAYLQVLTSTCTSCMTFNKLLALSGVQFSHLESRVIKEKSIPK